ncbi:hypothetical protein [Streptomyces sp. CMB-StM0423]|uniref:hypothetical protein n=1 Tax=Streptomyces sp. CMB-StM0423 TaxID=2059884 RepID=UPI00131E17D7|nr:hypothetical protein [Streptomyces sp. CMB-StM0423]
MTNAKGRWRRRRRGHPRDEQRGHQDGFTATVDSISEITEFGEWDDPPPAGQTPFRVTMTLDNRTAAPVDLDEMFLEAEGATNGAAPSSGSTWRPGRRRSPAASTPA